MSMEAPARPRRGARGLALGGVALVMGLILVAVPAASPAAANPAVGVAIAVGETLAAPAESAAAVSGSAACLASVVCAGVVAGGMVVGGLWAAGVIDLPFPTGIFSKGQDTTEGVPPTGFSTQLQFFDDPAYAGYVNVITSGVFQVNRGDIYWDYACRASDGTVSQQFHQYKGNVTWVVVDQSTPARQTPFNLCGGAAQVVMARMLVEGWNLSRMISRDVPAGSLSQTTTVHCRKPDGSTGEIKATNTGADGHVVLPSCREKFGPGAYPLDATIGGGWPGAEQTGVTVTMGNVPERYPDCFDAATGAYLNTCRVRVWINGQPCTSEVTVCRNWETYADDNPGADVECRWGPYEVAMSNCSLLKNSYKPDAHTQHLTTIDAGGYIYDPIYSPTPTGNPQPSPSPQPQPEPLPTAGPNPGPDDVPDPTPDDDPQSQSCWGQGWSWNPVSWVYVPVKCAFLWAFDPKTDVKGKVGGWKGEFDGKVPFGWIGGLSPGNPALGGDCPSWKVHVGSWSAETMCGTAWAADLRGARPWLAAGMIGLALSPFLRSLMYAFVPAFKLSRGSD